MRRTLGLISAAAPVDDLFSVGAQRINDHLDRAGGHAASRSSSTWSGYSQHWALRIGPRFGHLPVDEITRKDIQRFVDDRTVGPWAKVSPLRLPRSVLELAREDGRIHTNPARGWSAGRIPARDRHRYLTATEVATLSAACGDQGDIVTILAYTGVRWSELGRPARR